MTFSKNVFWYVDCKLPFYQIYYVQMSAGVKVDISCKKLHTRKYFQEKSLDRIYNVIYGPHLSRSILKESFQPILCHEIINSVHELIITYVSDFVCFRFQANMCENVSTKRLIRISKFIWKIRSYFEDKPPPPLTFFICFRFSKTFLLHSSAFSAKIVLGKPNSKRALVMSFLVKKWFWVVQCCWAFGW